LGRRQKSLAQFKLMGVAEMPNNLATLPSLIGHPQCLLCFLKGLGGRKPM
jgi:hypothetical protein